MIKYSSRVCRVLAVFVVAVMVFSAMPILFKSAPAVDHASAVTNYVHVGFLQDFSIWNPLNPDMVTDWVATFLMFSVLFQYDHNWEGPVNDLATGYYQVQHAGGNMTTYINITDNAYFRNRNNPTDTSHQLTAEDVEFTIELIIANEGGAWDDYVKDFTGVNATNPFQVAIDTAYPKAMLIDDLVWIPILPKYQWSQLQLSQVLAKSMKPEWLIGSGPFYFESLAKGSWYKFLRAPNYHGATDYPVGDPRGERVVDIEGILYTIYTDAGGMAIAMDDGIEDVIDISGAPELFIGLGGGIVPITKYVTDEMAIIDIAINALPEVFRTQNYGVGNKILLDPVVRKAILMTLNKQFIKNPLLGDLPIIADSVLSDSGGLAYWHKDIEGELPYDPAGAKALLQANGYTDTNGDSYLECTAASLAVQNNWAKVGARLEFDLEAPDTDPSYPTIGTNWVGWAGLAGIKLNYATRSESIMINSAWYACKYDIWIWSWYWTSEPLSNLAVWKTDEIKFGGDNCQMPMGPWWYSAANSSTGKAYSAYDENFSKAQRELNRDDRKVFVDQLQQMVYDSYCETPPVYPNGLYAFTTKRYVGWGNWTANIGRSVSSDLPWLWFDLAPSGANQPPVFDSVLSPDYQVVVNQAQLFSIEVHDPEGDPLTAVWNFGDGSPPVTETKTTGTANPTVFSQSHTYTTLAEPPNGLAMNVTVTDGNLGNVAISRATVLVIPVPDNVPRLVSPVLSDPTDMAYVNQDVTWIVGAADDESGGADGWGLQFTWDWDDGTFNTTHYYPTVDGAQQIDTKNHSWPSPGMYNIDIWVWDGSNLPGHNVSFGPIPYEIVENQPPSSPVISTITGNRDVAINCLATSSDADGDLLRFTWEWEPGSFSVTEGSAAPDTTVVSTIDHTWTAAGSYLVNVSVDDLTGELGHNVTANVTAVIVNPGQPAAPCALGLLPIPERTYPKNNVTFNASAVDTNGDALTMYVTFGDGNASVDTTAGGVTRQYSDFVHAYNETGVYDATLWADDGTGNNVSKTVQVTVVENSPPWLMVPTNASASYNKTFTLTPSRVRDNDTDPLQVWYDWGDGTNMSTGSLPHYAGSHVYTAMGNKTVQVFADDGTGLPGHNVTKTVNVAINENLRPTIVGEIVKTPSQGYKAGDTIMFTITVRDYEGDMVNITFNFGDGSALESIPAFKPNPDNLTVKTINHTFEKGSETSYTVTATVDDGLMKYHSIKQWDSRTTTVLVEKTATSNLALYVGVAVAAIAAALLILFLLTRRKKGAAPKEEVGGMEGMAPPAEPPPPPA